MLRGNSNEYTPAGNEKGDLHNGNEEKSLNSCPSPRPQSIADKRAPKSPSRIVDNGPVVLTRSGRRVNKPARFCT